ncbi:MAG: T9SS type A sorting domain-containing protein [Janthinobacterium lividum]
MLTLAMMPAFGQIPWSYVTSSKEAYYNYMQYLSAPQPNVLWGMSTSYQMMQTSSSTVFRTIDNGQTWEQAPVTGYSRPQGPMGPAVGTQAEDLAVLGDQQAWLLRYTILNIQTGNPELCYTSTGPMGFATRGSVLPAAFRKIHFFTSTTGVAVANPEAGATTWLLYRTTDGGLTWALIATSPALQVGTSERVTGKNSIGNSLWLSTAAGTLLYTADAGLTWATASALDKVVFEDAQHGLAYYAGDATSGKDPALLRTTDGGHTWAKVAYTGQPELQSITAVPGQPGTYISVGGVRVPNFIDSNGITAISNDYGTSWNTIQTAHIRLELVTAASATQVWGSHTGTPGPQLLHYEGTALPTQAASVALQVSAYPNPTTGMLYLAGSLPTQAKASLYDATGRLCQTTPLADLKRTVDLSAQAPGIYQLVITAADGIMSSLRVHKVL